MIASIADAYICGACRYVVVRSASVEVFDGRFVPYVVDHYIGIISISAAVDDAELSGVVDRAIRDARATYPGAAARRKLPPGYVRVNGRVASVCVRGHDSPGRWLLPASLQR